MKELRKRKGYGGTDFRPAFTWTEENKPRTRVFIYFTDGYGTYPEKYFGDWVTIWVLNNKEIENPKFGYVVRMK